MMDRSGYSFDGIMPEDSPEFFRENLPEVYTAYADNAVVAIAQAKTTSVQNQPKLLLTKA